MTSLTPPTLAVDTHKHGLLFVFAAGVLWSTVGLGIRMIEDAVVWQILLYRSISMSLFLYMVILNFVAVPGHWGTLPLSMKGALNGTTSKNIYRRF